MGSEFSSFVACRVPIELKQQIKEFQAKYRFSSESRAIQELLRAGIFLDARRKELEQPEIVKYLQQHLYDQLLADWIFNLPGDRLDALLGAFRSAKELRSKVRY